MSALYVDSIKDKSDTKTLATLSNTATTLHSDVVFPSGHILQVVGNTSSSDVVLGTGYTSVISKEITGVLASSRILVIVCGGGAGYNSTTISVSYKITRGASESDTTVREYDTYSSLEGDGHWRPCPVSLQGLDESPSTGNITYTVWGKKSGGSYWRASSLDITIYEISG
ncbi:hypothetical protein [uncultured Mediterranean phage uvMED]|nr:hypothetical protein [uncultured Mediterranean phage uvMED]